MELLIMRVDQYPAFHEGHGTGLHAGDVITACPDGWPWSEAETSNPNWMIISSPITAIEADALLAGGRVDEPPLQRRTGLKIDGLSSGDVITRSELMARTS